MTKQQFTIAALASLPPFIIYMLFSFYNLSMDIAMWSEGSRALCATAMLGASAVGVVIGCGLKLRLM